MLIDTHCHLTDEAFKDDVDEVIKRAKEAGIGDILCLAWDIDSSKELIEFNAKHPSIKIAVGVHPENIDGLDLNEAIKELEDMASIDGVVAIGEIGLDYHWKNDKETKRRQKDFFEAQIRLANRCGLPFIVHSRDAIEDTYEIIAKSPINRAFIMHCYSGSPEMMDRFMTLKNCYFGFDGPITYKNAKTPVECVLKCPMTRILTETDSPYLPPVPFRGQRNEPSYIKEILEKMADIKDVSIKVMEKQVENNFERFLNGYTKEEMDAYDRHMNELNDEEDECLLHDEED